MVLILEKVLENFENDRDSKLVNLEMFQNSKNLKSFFFDDRRGNDRK